MLTIPEKILFVVAVIAALYFGYVNFRKVFRVIARGHGEWVPRDEMMQRAQTALWEWLSIKPIWKTRSVASIFHAMIAWGFVFYFLVNFGDVMEGFFDIKFLGGGFIGSIYRFTADFFTLSVLLGMIYFLWRRFVVADKALSYRENVMLVDKVKAGGIRRDSLIVGGFMILHVGGRAIGESFKIAAERTAHGVGDPGQPFADGLSRFWDGMSLNSQIVGWHVGWWVALGLILPFIPYFPYTKHFHLAMSAVHFFSKPKRTSLGTLDAIDFTDESLEEFGVAKIEDLPWTHLADAYACIMCNRCQDVCPAYVTGKELSPSALEVNKRYYLNDNLDALANGEASEFNLIDFAISESAIWACTSCGACVDICPVGK